ncbi:methyltransferase [Flavisolibacter tropicus]|uniref:Methyltransferase n=1 Tax=Flavisolibacter tropicus TaxID=1492898 RepID=A0A172TX59_9BACT|nr:methyltransferase [Flavisolibacter tropicus]ANE51596.1 methyltransferase [Flavisolibacter tropicus]
MQALHEELVTSQVTPTTTPNPSAIMQVGTGFWASKTLLAAIKLRLFTELEGKALTAEEIRQKLDLHPRSIYDFLDALHSLKFLNREGQGTTARYSNTADTSFFLDRNKQGYIGGLLEMCNDRLYPFWGTLEDGLKTGKPQNEVKDESTDANPFDAFYADPDRLTQFMEAMAGIQMGAFMALARNFDFSRYQTLCDMGGATGLLAIQVALNNPHMQTITYDLPAVEQVAKKWVERFDAVARVRIQSGDFFKDPFPKADIITMGNILHDWGYEDKLKLAKKAYEALPAGGAFIVIEGIIDNERKENTFGLLMSLNMLIETQAGYDFTFNDFQNLAKEAGFTRFELLHLAGPTSAAIAYK